jgi:hypothetical protein
MPAPVAAESRAPRRPVIFGLIRDWHTNGVNSWERAHLEAAGYGRWLARGRLTDGMIVELLLDRLATLDYLAADHGRDPRDDRAREIGVLMRWRATEVPAGLDRAEIDACLEMLQRLDRGAAKRFARTGRLDGSEDGITQLGTRLIEERFPAVITATRNAVTAARTSTDALDIGPRVLLLGERPSLAADAQALRQELGERFLDPRFSPEYRAARVRKWRQFALRASARRPAVNAPRPSERERMLRHVSQGMRRQAIESAFLRGATPELGEEDERRAAYLRRFSTLSRKASRRGRFRVSVMRAIAQQADKPGDS